MVKELSTPKSSSKEEPKRSLFSYSPVNLKGVTRELGRLNRNIELLLKHVFQVDVNELQKGEERDDGVSYSSDEESLKDELTADRRGPEDDEEITYS